MPYAKYHSTLDHLGLDVAFAQIGWFSYIFCYAKSAAGAWFLLHVCLPTQKNNSISRDVNNMFQIAPVLLPFIFWWFELEVIFLLVRCTDYCTAQSVNPLKIKKLKVVQHPPLQKSLQSDVWILTYDIWSFVLTRWTKPMLLTATSNLHGHTVLAQDRKMFRPWICQRCWIMAMSWT